MMLGDPGGIVAKAIRFDDLTGYACMNVAVGIRLPLDIGMRCKQNAEFHTQTFPAGSCR